MKAKESTRALILVLLVTILSVQTWTTIGISTLLIIGIYYLENKITWKKQKTLKNK